MRILVTLDVEEPLDPEEALGHILIAGDTDAQIQNNNVWIDDWLIALIAGVQALSQSEREYSSEIESESYPLIFKSVGQGFSISFGDSTVTGDNLHLFEPHLKVVIKQVMDKFDSGSEFRPDSFWAQLKQYANE